MTQSVLGGGRPETEDGRQWGAGWQMWDVGGLMLEQVVDKVTVSSRSGRQSEDCIIIGMSHETPANGAQYCSVETLTREKIRTCLKQLAQTAGSLEHQKPFA
ncbi:hypothetical protein [Algoriphagus sp. NG3]|uniref:hypothetical protein n=1 Tax=Algoriphagus sp. NG3 TaxID=3097546 RepID=UPI002A803BD9|nr:hypothetical protein [Algoriphagus sp. NG3]WPR77531.1 hypothetical protein SLW71_09245 [Algoriphagus sp. NG3]